MLQRFSVNINRLNRYHTNTHPVQRRLHEISIRNRMICDKEENEGRQHNNSKQSKIQPYAIATIVVVCERKTLVHMIQR